MVDLIKTGVDISNTIKNVSRFKEIISVFAKNGFNELLAKSGIHQKIPNFVLPRSTKKFISNNDLKDQSWPKLIGNRLRVSFEELGSSFVKLGQLLSTREDFFDEEFIFEMKKLQDQVEGIPFEQAKSIITNSLAQDPAEVFQSINPNPIGRASIGVVYEGKLHSGEDIIIKVRRPGIARKIKSDFSILSFVIEQLEKVSLEIKYLGLSRMIRDFSKNIMNELDYRIEAKNCEKFKQVIGKLDHDKIIYIPKIYQEYSTQDVLVMEKLKGIPFSRHELIYPKRDQIAPRLEKGLEYFIYNILVDGFFHADLHGGNFFLLENDVIGIIDFGSVGTLEKKSRSHLAAILYFLVSNNYENLVYEFLEVAEYETVPDIESLTRDIKDCLAPFTVLSVNELNIGELFQAITKTLARHEIFLPREWFLVFRSMVTLDGVGKSLDIDIDIFGIVDKNISSIIKDLTSKEQLLEEAFWIGRDVFSSLRNVPRHLRWFLKEISKRNYSPKIELTGFQKNIENLSRSISFTGLIILTASLFFTGVYSFHKTSHHPLAWVSWSLSFIIFIFALIKGRKK